MKQNKSNPNIRIGITHGDINGIGYEIIIKTLMDKRIFENTTPIIFGSSKVASYHRKALNINNFNLNLVKSPDQAVPEHPNIVNITENEIKVELGVPTASSGELAYMSLEAAVDALKKKQIDVLVTAPINKSNIQSDQFSFPGHTEYLAQRFGKHDDLMLMINRELRIGVITGHMPLKEVPAAITMDLLLRKISILNDSLQKDFAIVKPRIALLGLNPHASDKGLLGQEEQEIIIPAIEEATRRGMLVFGPYPADGLFGSLNYRKFDGILAMYHDQGMLPFKTLAFSSGINYTAGLPIVRTSPAHGTAFEIAGKGLASPESFHEAIYLACDVFRNRREYDMLRSNAFETNSSITTNNPETHP
jgi:4-hydroxythreonine-4-phosphate dehydrogenase